MKFLGIDYGTKRIGLAVSDEEGTLAFPKEILGNDANLYKKIGGIIKEEKISHIVVGESLSLEGAPNPVAARIAVFITELEKNFGLPVRKQKEFLTSVEARRPMGEENPRNATDAHSREKKDKGKRVDASAAALILQRYLDAKNKK